MTKNEIVVGIDGSAAGAAAMQWAENEARLRGSDLRIVVAWQVDNATLMAGVGIPWLAMESDVRSHAANWVKDAIGDVDTDGKPRAIEIIQGVPGPSLVQASADSQMLVVGTQVHRGLSRVMHGSVSHYCLTHASNVVVAVPAPAED